MSKALKWVGYGLGGLVGLIIVASAFVWVGGNRRLNRTYDIPGHALDIPDDSAAVANGERLASVYGCRDCHGEDLGGSMFIDAAAFARIAAPNLTTGNGGVADSYSARDFERAIRHGIARDGRSLFIMPAQVYQHFADTDIAEVIAFLQAAPPVDRAFAKRRFGPMARLAVLMAGGELVPASIVEHDEPHVAAVEHGATVEFGRYLAKGCIGCHAADYSGSDDGIGDGPPAANITPDRETGIGSWTYEEFERALRQGTRPDGSAIDSTMPWPAMSRLTDDEMRGVWMFLQTLEPVRAQRGQ